MSRTYTKSEQVPDAVLAKRLEELSNAVMKKGEDRDRELTMRVPAELDRDADLVLGEAAQRLNQRADSLARLKAEWQAEAISGYAHRHLGGTEQELAEIYASKLRHQAEETV